MFLKCLYFSAIIIGPSWLTDCLNQHRDHGIHNYSHHNKNVGYNYKILPNFNGSWVGSVCAKRWSETAEDVVMKKFVVCMDYVSLKLRQHIPCIIYRKHNHLQRLELPCRVSLWEYKHDIKDVEVKHIKQHILFFVCFNISGQTKLFRIR